MQYRTNQQESLAMGLKHLHISRTTGNHPRLHLSTSMDPSWQLGRYLINSVRQQLHERPNSAFKRKVSNCIPLILIEIKGKMLRVHGRINLRHI